MIEGKDRHSQVLSVGREILQIQDLDVLLERILTEARRFVNADAGSLYLKEGDNLKFSYTQNETLQAKLEPGKKMKYSTFSIPISNSSISGYVANNSEVLNIPDAYEIPEGSPYGFGREFDEAVGYRTQSMLTFPVLNTRKEVLGVLQLINARDDKGAVIPFDKSDEPYVMHFADNASLAMERAQMTRAILMRMIGMAELRDPKETGPHVNRVAAYSVEIYEQWARKQGMEEDKLQRNRDLLRMAAMLHDVGKIAITDTILKKPGRLDPEERAVMEEHAMHGARLFTDKYSDFDDASMMVALCHHEKWDGTGYPGHIDPTTGKPLPGYEAESGKARGKKGEEIHPFGRIVALADVFDALSCKRSYKDPWPEQKVLDTLQQDAGTHFDPGMVEVFIASIDNIRTIADRYPD
jgi:HD-GYP domain-containing protein (c-di-GMP phosphodiesterase class II)